MRDIGVAGVQSFALPIYLLGLLLALPPLAIRFRRGRLEDAWSLHYLAGEGCRFLQQRAGLGEVSGGLCPPGALDAACGMPQARSELFGGGGFLQRGGTPPALLLRVSPAVLLERLLGAGERVPGGGALLG